MLNLARWKIIVVVASGIFLVSMILGVRRGVLVRWVRHAQLSRRVARQHLLHGRCIEDPVRRKPAAEQPLANGPSKMIEQPGRETARGALDPPVEHRLRQIGCEGATGESPVPSARPPLPARDRQALFHDRL